MDADAPLPTDVPALQAMVRGLRAENADLRTQLRDQAEQFQRTIDELRTEVAALKAKVDRATTHRFGRRSERTPRPPKAPGDPPAKQRHDHGRSPLPAHLERRDTVLDLTPEERRCPGCGGDRVCIGQTQTEQLDCDPTPYFVRRTVRKTYACQQCPPAGRSNWKFVGSAPAGERAAVHFSVVGTCRHLGLDAAAYLRDVLPDLHALGEKPTDDQLAALLPDAWAKRQHSRLNAA